MSILEIEKSIVKSLSSKSAETQNRLQHTIYPPSQCWKYLLIKEQIPFMFLAKRWDFETLEFTAKRSADEIDLCHRLRISSRHINLQVNVLTNPTAYLKNNNKQQLVIRRSTLVLRNMLVEVVEHWTLFSHSDYSASVHYCYVKILPIITEFVKIDPNDTAERVTFLTLF